MTRPLTSILNAAEPHLLRAALNLPVSVQRMLLRRPIVRDGQVLAPETQMLLTLQRLARIPGAETLPLERGRRELVRHCRLSGGRQSVGAVRDLEVAGAEGKLPARLYTPTSRVGPDPAPTLLFLHGGGWVYGDLASHDAPCRFLAENSGVQVLAVDYRRAPEHRYPAAVEDAWSAYDWLVRNVEEVNADPAFLAVGGDSAGGALAASTAVWAAERGLPMAFQLLIYPATDFVERAPSREMFGAGFYLTTEFMDFAEECYFAPGADKSEPDASALRRTSFPDGLAPALVVTAGFDPLRDEGEAYARLLAEHGVNVELRRFPSMIHGFFNIVGAGHETIDNNREIAHRLGQALR